VSSKLASLHRKILSQQNKTKQQQRIKQTKKFSTASAFFLGMQSVYAAVCTELALAHCSLQFPLPQMLP
jgi:hypothetical protein